MLEEGTGKYIASYETHTDEMALEAVGYFAFTHGLRNKMVVQVVFEGDGAARRNEYYERELYDGT